jgi:hypothetical protein
MEAIAEKIEENTVEKPCELCLSTGYKAGRYNLQNECCWYRFLKPIVADVRRRESMKGWILSMRSSIPEAQVEKVRALLKTGS